MEARSELSRSFTPAQSQRVAQEQPGTAACSANMSERAEACRRRAAECERVATLVRDEHARLLYLDLANYWRFIAEQAEAMERQRSKLNDLDGAWHWLGGPL
jgi:hypothetical protein